MATKRDHYLLTMPGLMGLAVLHAWWTQPHIGPPSLASVAVRSVVISLWLLLALITRRTQFDCWSWKQFFIGGLSGGGWLIMLFPMGDTSPKSLAIISTALVYGVISGLFAARSATTWSAAGTGILMLAGQVVVDLAAMVLGWTKVSRGM